MITAPDALGTGYGVIRWKEWGRASFLQIFKKVFFRHKNHNKIQQITIATSE
jgi:hypothetical protein